MALLQSEHLLGQLGDLVALDPVGGVVGLDSVIVPSHGDLGGGENPLSLLA
jgi:hypothetical protein